MAEAPPEGIFRIFIAADIQRVWHEPTKTGEAQGAVFNAWLHTTGFHPFTLGHADANALAHALKDVAAGDDPLDAIYTGAKAHLRPLHDKVMASIAPFGAFECAPKKGYVSLRRKKQFATVGPATKDAIEIGLNVRDLEPDRRLKAVPPGGMCSYTLRISSAAEADAALAGWLRRAFDGAG